jgi:chromosome segregation ATPase
LQVQNLRENLDKGNDAFGSSLKRVEELKEEKEALARKYEFAKFRLEDSEIRAKKAKDLYQDTATDLWSSEGNIEVVKREYIEIRCHRDAIYEQIQMMKQGAGFSC